MGRHPIQPATPEPLREVAYRFLEGPLGPGVVAWDGLGGQGVCALFFGQGKEDLTRELAGRFPHSRRSLSHDLPEGLEGADVAAVLAAGARAPVRLVVEGTALQRQVWGALRRIRAGQTHTYGGIARDIGRAGAARAVAGACAANPIALLIPCHRVVPSSGGLGGYRWGRQRKQALLAMEAVLRG